MSANIYQLARIPILSRCKGYYLRWWYNGWHYWQFIAGGLDLQTTGENYRTYGQRSVTVSSGMITEAQANAIRTITNSREVYIYTDSGWRLVRLITSTMQISNNFINGYEIQFVLNIGSRLISITGYSPVEDIIIVPPDPDMYCELEVGTQIWMCKNWDAAYPDSKVYRDREDYREPYGGLYRGTQVMNAGFAPAGWHLPTQAEWEELFNFVAASWVTAGKELKAAGTDYWLTGNTGVDTQSFGARGGGYYNGLTRSWLGLEEDGYFWTATPYGTYSRFAINMKYNGDYAMVLGMPTVHYCSVRLIKDTAAVLHVSDWYLPSIDALVAINTVLYAYGLGGLAADAYWSSTEEVTGLGARMFDFSTGIIILNATKFANYDHVRPIRSFVTADIYALRSVGQAGGLVFHVVDNGDGTYTYYEMYLLDVSVSEIWSDVAGLAGATGITIGTGMANTLAIVGQAGVTTAAAILCNDLVT